jgi:hypothetical protein
MTIDVLLASIIIIALASMMCVSGSYYYELTCIDEKVFNEFLIGK